MGSRTWVKLYTDKWFEGSIRQETPLVRSVFVDLLALAGSIGETGFITIPGSSKTMQNACFGYSDAQIACILHIAENDWKIAKCRLSAHSDPTENRITIHANNVIEIINWNKYQSEYDKRRDANRNRADKISALEGEGEGEKKELYSAAFQSFWNAYPRRIGKQVAHDAFKRASKQYPAKDMVSAAVEYAKICQKERREEKFILHPATFLNKDRWKDYCFEDACA